VFVVGIPVPFEALASYLLVLIAVAWLCRNPMTAIVVTPAPGDLVIKGPLFIELPITMGLYSTLCVIHAFIGPYVALYGGQSLLTGGAL